MDATKVLAQLERLITDGTLVVATRKSPPPNVFGPASVDPAMFQEWGTNVIVTFEAAFGQTHHFVEQAKRLTGDAWRAGEADRLLAVVKSARTAVEQEVVAVANVASSLDPSVVLFQVFDRFHAVARQLRDRRKDHGTGRVKQPRPTLNVSDEYDVQDLLHALLKLFFADVRREEWTPSVASAAKRIDLMLWQEQIAIETKMTRAGLDATRLVDELIIDIRHYKTHPRCHALYCFVYDPAEIITNPASVESDLAEHTDGFDVRILVRHR